VLKLVEYNTVAVSLLPTSDRIKLLQDTLIRKYRDDLAMNYSDDFKHFIAADAKLVNNPILQDGYSSFDEMVGSFVKAINIYRQSTPGESLPWVLFVVEEQERNMTD